MLPYVGGVKVKNDLLAVLAVAVGLLIASGPMFAHHSMAVYDRSREVTIQGTVTKFQFANPHTQIMIDVKKENGEIENWTAVASPPNGLRRAGWRRDSIKPGDQITVTGFPHKDGRPIMAVLGKVVVNSEELPTGSLD